MGDLKFPLIVKPPQEDASLGITSKSVVRDIRELLGTMDSLQREFQSPVLVEEFVDGREFYVGVLGNVNPIALPVIELDFSAFPADRPKVASWEAKWGEGGTGGRSETGAEFAGTKSVFPTDLAPELAERMQRVAVEAFNALRLRDYGRVDLRVTPAEEIYVIEVNPNCYLEQSGEFARAAAESGDRARRVGRADRGAGAGALLTLSAARMVERKKPAPRRRLLRCATTDRLLSACTCGPPSWHPSSQPSCERRPSWHQPSLPTYEPTSWRSSSFLCGHGNLQ